MGKNHYYLIIIFIVFANVGYSQVRPMQPDDGSPIRKPTLNDRNSTRNNINQKTSDTTKKKSNTKLDTLGFERRNDLADSINVTYRFLDSLRRQPLDSSINNFDNYYSVPSHYQYLGNNGAAAFPLIFSPFTKAGWDAGFHAFDIYKYTLANTKFYKVTGPFSMLGYQLAGGKEQMVQALHTQSPRQNINFGFDYRLISAPGFFVTQNTNHNNVRFFGNYIGNKKRYNASFIYLTNIIKSSENGGITDNALLLDKNKKDRFAIPVKLGGALPFTPNPFQANVITGNIYREKILFIRQSYDLGKKDSIAINDSTTEYLFYSKLRLQHTLTVSTNTYNFVDPKADSLYYRNNYKFNFANRIDSFELYEKWQTIQNDFTLIQYPNTKNAAQYLAAGITLQNIIASTSRGKFYFENIMLHGTYKNRTRNKLWDILLHGEFYTAGLNLGDYKAEANLSRFINKKLGAINLFFINTSRSPSFIFDNRSSFNIKNTNNFKKENITSFGATSTNAFATVGFKNHFITNLAYFTTLSKQKQYSKPINIFQAFASKKIKLKQSIFYYADATIQVADNGAPIRVPLLYTRSRIAYEGNLYKNLQLSTGLEIRYYTPYKANNYSPLLGQFAVQDSVTIINTPDISAFFHFRIKSFSTYVRAENLNTVSFKNGFGFINNNFAAPGIPTQGFMLRVGIRWWFVK